MFPNFNNNARKEKPDVKITKDMLHDVRETPNQYLQPNGRTKLQQALVDGHDDFVMKMIERDHVRLRVIDNKGCNLMHYAVEKKNRRLISKLKELGVPLDSRDKEGKTPFMKLFEAKKPNLRLANWLLEQGANADQADKRGRRALHVAAEKHNLNVVSFLLKVTKNTDKPDHTGVRPFHYAVEHNDASVVQEFSHHRVDLKSTNNKSQTVFHMALENKNAKVLQFLLKTEAVKVLNQPEMDTKEAAIHKAVSKQNVDAVQQMLAAGANINAQAKDGTTPLAMAVSEDSEEMVRSLLDKGADIVYGECSALEESISYNESQHFSILMEYAPDPNMKGKDGKTALMRATQYGHEKIVDELLSAGADPNMLSREKQNALFFLGFNSKSEIVEKLIDEGINVNQVDQYGRTPLLEAMNGSYDLDNIKALVNAGADVNHKDGSGQTALHHTLRSYSPDIKTFTWLLENGVDLQKIAEGDNDRQPILHQAAEVDGSDAPLRKLLEAGLDVDKKDQTGATALMVATRMYNKKNIELLLEYGADPDIETSFGESPRKAATRHWNNELKEIYDQFDKRKRFGLSPKFTKEANKNKPPKPPHAGDFKGPKNGTSGGFAL